MYTPLTQTRLREVLDYNLATGVFTWKLATSNRAKAGMEAGSVHKTFRRRYIVVDGKKYFASRLAWFYVYGSWPVDQLDHRDRDPPNDRISNLREASDSQNKENRTAQRNSKTGQRGVWLHLQSGKYRAVICKNRKHYHLGLFDTVGEASAAYNAAKALHHPFQPHLRTP